MTRVNPHPAHPRFCILRRAVLAIPSRPQANSVRLSGSGDNDCEVRPEIAGIGERTAAAIGKYQLGAR